MHATTPMYHLFQEEKTANIHQLTSYPFNFEKLLYHKPGRGGGYSVIFIHTRAWTIFFYSIFLISIFWGFSEKSEYFWGHFYAF